MNNTIAAISTPNGSGAIAIVRMSGEQSIQIIDKFFRPYVIGSMKNAEPNKLYLGEFLTGNVKDKCLCVYFKAPFSFTGEDVIEIQCHGGTRLTSGILSALLTGGCSIATKGEFTRRAFYNNKMSLSQAEGVIDMINAESLSQINGAYALQSGALNTEVTRLSELLVTACAHLEVILDSETFEDEIIAKSISKTICRDVLNGVTGLLSGRATTNKYNRDGIRVAIVGQTNMGKSSLLNCLCGYSRAIVTDIAGTTRDIIEEKVEYDGFLFRFVDTAGLRESSDRVEEIGIELAKKQAAAGDIVLVVVDGNNGIMADDLKIINEYKSKPLILCLNKIDLCGKVKEETIKKLNNENIQFVKISSLSLDNNIGIDDLFKKIIETLKVNNVSSGGLGYLRERHIEHLKAAEMEISELIENIDITPIDCVIFELYNVISELKNIEGADANNLVIDAVFSKFCVGK